MQWLEGVPVERLFDVYIAPIDVADLPRMVMLTLRDLSEIRRVERMRVDFVANVSKALVRGREKDPIRTVRASGYSLDETLFRG